MPTGMPDVVRRAVARVSTFLVIAAVAGCAAPADRSAHQPQSAGTTTINASMALDPCAMNLHDISGAMLAHLNLHGRFPATLDTLQPPPGSPSLSVGCPVSGQPYVFNPGGIHLVERSAYIIVYDASPAHNGRRWAIIMDEPQPDKAPYMEVLQVPESLFLLHQAD